MLIHEIDFQKRFWIHSSLSTYRFLTPNQSIRNWYHVKDPHHTTNAKSSKTKWNYSQIWKWFRLKSIFPMDCCSSLAFNDRWQQTIEHKFQIVESKKIKNWFQSQNRMNIDHNQTHLIFKFRFWLSTSINHQAKSIVNQNKIEQHQSIRISSKLKLERRIFWRRKIIESNSRLMTMMRVYILVMRKMKNRRYQTDLIHHGLQS